ncbi:hypothetical protein T459_12409 [Capsicum annuum]|uniref:Uncharacterized protein n=1 Tax=Capsicum annuum TaxID=4072 RepID=A0A2G2ZPP8_CAPAN|nr:hypothetical protein T459_12409 [Capsicum annuum]
MLSYQPSTFRNFSTSDVIRGKGYEVSRGTFNRLIKRFEKEKMSGDVKKLKELYGSSELVDNLSENVCHIGKYTDNSPTLMALLHHLMDFMS